MRSCVVWLSTVLLAALTHPLTPAPSAVPAQQPKRFEGLTNSDNPIIDKDGRALALYMDPSRDTLPAAPAPEGEAFLIAVASEGTSLLTKLELAKTFLRLDRPMLGGTPLHRFLLIAVYPRIGSSGTGRRGNLMTFSPGNTRVIQELSVRFGPARETEVWSSGITRQAGLDATVSWWGSVGVATAEDGSITHVLVRQAVDLTSVEGHIPSRCDKRAPTGGLSGYQDPYNLS